MAPKISLSAVSLLLFILISHSSASFATCPPSSVASAALRLEDSNLVRAFLYYNTSLLLTTPFPPTRRPLCHLRLPHLLAVGSIRLPSVVNLGMCHVAVPTNFSFVHVITSPFPPSAVTFIDAPPLYADIATGSCYLISAVAVAGKEDIPILSSDPAYAAVYNQGLLGHLKSGRVGPLRGESAAQGPGGFFRIFAAPLLVMAFLLYGGVDEIEQGVAAPQVVVVEAEEIEDDQVPDPECQHNEDDDDDAANPQIQKKNYRRRKMLRDKRFNMKHGKIGRVELKQLELWKLTSGYIWFKIPTSKLNRRLGVV